MSRPAPRLILTRPDPDNGPWLQALTRAGVAALAWPLIEIEASAHSASALARAWNGLTQCRAVMFVSRAAVVHFFAHRPAEGAWPDATRAWCTGPGTRQALMAQGLAPQQIDAPAQDASWDTEHLWPVVCQQIQPGHVVLFVRGDDAPLAGTVAPSPTQTSTGVGRDWLAQQVAVFDGGRVVATGTPWVWNFASPATSSRWTRRRERSGIFRVVLTCIASLIRPVAPFSPAREKA